MSPAARLTSMMQPRRLAQTTAGSFILTETAYVPGYAQPRHAHADSAITLVLAGSLEETVARSHEYAHALSLVVKPLDTEHQNTFGSAGARTLQIRLAPNVIDQEAHVLDAWRWQHRGAAVRAALRVLSAFRAGRTHDMEIAIMDLIAGLGRLDVASGPPPRWLLQARDQIDTLLPGAVRVDDVARYAAVHPVYLARQFRRFLLCSVSEYIAGRRLQIAAELLGGSTSTLSDAAFRAGYADQSHMTRAFRAATGLTPGRFRGVVATEV